MNPETKAMLEAELGRIVRWERTEYNETGYDADGQVVVVGCLGPRSGYDDISDAQDLLAHESQDDPGVSIDDWA